MIKFNSDKIQHIEGEKYTILIGKNKVKVELTDELIKNLRGMNVATTDNELEEYLIRAAMKWENLAKQKNPTKQWDDLDV